MYILIPDSPLRLSLAPLWCHRDLSELEAGVEFLWSLGQQFSTLARSLSVAALLCGSAASRLCADQPPHPWCADQPPRLACHSQQECPSCALLLSLHGCMSCCVCVGRRCGASPPCTYHRNRSELWVRCGCIMVLGIIHAHSSPSLACMFVEAVCLWHFRQLLHEGAKIFGHERMLRCA